MGIQKRTLPIIIHLLSFIFFSSFIIIIWTGSFFLKMILTSHYHNENGSLLFGAAENKFPPLYLANWKNSTQGQSAYSQPIGDKRTVPLFLK